MTGTIEIGSVRDPDGQPVCALTWDTEQWYAPVAQVRQTALDLITCAAYVEMMREMVTGGGLSPPVVQTFTAHLLRSAGRTLAYGNAETVSLIPSWTLGRGPGKPSAVVLLARGALDAYITAAEARDIAGVWLAAAEATESDQLVAEAFTATQPGNDAGLDRLFGYLRKLRERAS